MNPYVEQEIRRSLRQLCIDHGYKNVDTIFKEMCKETYDDLKIMLGARMFIEFMNLAEDAKEKKDEPQNEIVEKKDAAEEKKRIHKEKVMKKKEEMAQAGINPNSLLTEENMKKWIADGKSYWWISEETGAAETDVSVIAKQFGLQSNVSKLYRKK